MAHLTLWNNGDAAAYKQGLDSYEAIVQELHEYRTKSASKKSGKAASPELAQVDEFQREELPRLLEERAAQADGAYITKEEHCKLVKWKMQRNKQRPGHEKYASETTDSAVRDATRKALNLLAAAAASDSPDRGSSDTEVTEEAVLQAAAAYSALKGTAVATSTALLSAADPSGSVPFMGEEALEATGLKSDKYSAQVYTQLVRKLRSKARELTTSSTADGNPKTWTAVEVERALWAAARQEWLAGRQEVAQGGEGQQRKRQRKG